MQAPELCMAYGIVSHTFMALLCLAWGFCLDLPSMQLCQGRCLTDRTRKRLLALVVAWMCPIFSEASPVPSPGSDLMRAGVRSRLSKFSFLCLSGDDLHRFELLYGNPSLGHATLLR